MTCCVKSLVLSPIFAVTNILLIDATVYIMWYEETEGGKIPILLTINELEQIGHSFSFLDMGNRIGLMTDLFVSNGLTNIL